MEIRISYSQTQLDSAVKFISENNEHFYGQDDYIRKSILEYMERMAKDPNSTFIGTMGFTLIGDREFEDLDNDENVVRVEILVDPGLGNDDMYSDGDMVDNIISAPAQSIWNKEETT
jgi:hypothetical protein